MRQTERKTDNRTAARSGKIAGNQPTAEHRQRSPARTERRRESERDNIGIREKAQLKTKGATIARVMQNNIPTRYVLLYRRAINTRKQI